MPVCRNGISRDGEPRGVGVRVFAYALTKDAGSVASAFGRMVLSLQCQECSNGPESVWVKIPEVRLLKR